MSWTKNIIKVEIGTVIEEIGHDTFLGAETLTSIKIPSSVIAIGTDAFSNTSISEVDIDDIKSFCRITFHNESSHPNSHGACQLKVNGSVCTDIVIPSGVTRIESYTFLNFKDIITVTIPSFVTHVGEFAFAYCDDLSRVDFGGPCDIGASAFFDSHSLMNVYMLTETVEQVQGKENYPWGLPQGCTIHCSGGENIVVQGGSRSGSGS